MEPNHSKSSSGSDSAYPSPPGGGQADAGLRGELREGFVLVQTNQHQKYLVGEDRVCASRNKTSAVAMNSLGGTTRGWRGRNIAAWAVGPRQSSWCGRTPWPPLLLPGLSAVRRSSEQSAPGYDPRLQAGKDQQQHSVVFARAKLSTPSTPFVPGRARVHAPPEPFLAGGQARPYTHAYYPRPESSGKALSCPDADTASDGADTCASACVSPGLFQPRQTSIQPQDHTPSWL